MFVVDDKPQFISEIGGIIKCMMHTSSDVVVQTLQITHIYDVDYKPLFIK